MWIRVPLLLLGATAAGFKCPPYTTVPQSKTTARGSESTSRVPPNQQPASGVVLAESCSSSDAKRVFVRTKTGVIDEPLADHGTTCHPATNMPSGTANTAKSFLVTTTEIFVATLANTGPSRMLLKPLHKWSTSRKRVAEAVEAAAAAATIAEVSQLQALHEQHAQRRAKFPLPQRVKNTCDAFLSVISFPGQLKREAEKMSTVAETVGAMPDRLRYAVAQGKETVKEAQAAAVEASDRVRGIVTKAQELPRQVDRAFGEGVEAVAAAVETGRRASEAIESLPSRLPGRIEAAGDEIRSLAEGSAVGVDAAATALWAGAKAVVVWAAELAIRQALAPVHRYQTSVRRVQAAVDEERAALLSTRTVAQVDGLETAISGTTDMATSPYVVAAEHSTISKEQTTQEGPPLDSNGDIVPVSRLAGLRRRFSAWRRKRNAMATAAVGLTEKYSGDDIEKHGSGRLSIVAVAPEPCGGAAEADAQTKLKVAATRPQAATIKGRQERGVVPATPTAPVTDARFISKGKVREREERPIVAAGSVVDGSIEAPTKGKTSPVPPGALAYTSSTAEACAAAAAAAAAEASAAVHAASLPFDVPGVREEEDKAGKDGNTSPASRAAAGDPLQTPGSQGTAATATGAERRFGRVEAAKGQGKPQSASVVVSISPVGGAISAAVKRARNCGTRAGGGTSGDGDGGFSKEERDLPPSSSSGAVLAASPEIVATTASSPVGGTGEGGSEELRGKLDADAPKKELKSLEAGPGGTMAAAATNVMKADTDRSVDASTSSSTAAGPGADQKQPSAAASGRGQGQASAASPATAAAAAAAAVPPSPSEGTAMSPPHMTSTSTSPTSASGVPAGRRDRSSNLATQKERVETTKEKDDREEAIENMPRPDGHGDSLITAVAAEDVATRGVSRAFEIAGGTVGPGSSSRAKGASTDAAEFLKSWKKKAVPQKKTELERIENGVCWERQWYPVAIVSELNQKQQQQRWRLRRQRRLDDDERAVPFQMLGREYELVPPTHVGQATTDHEQCQWGCRASIADDRGRTRDSARPAAAARVPLKESGGLLWAWPDTTPEGLKAAALASPAPLGGFSGTGGDREGGETPSPWRRLRRGQQRKAESRGEGGGGSGGGRWGGVEEAGERWNEILVEQEISCRYADAVGELLSPSHGQAVRAVAAGENGDDDGDAADDGGLWTAAGLTAASGSNQGVWRAPFDTPLVQGEVLFASPTVVRWSFSPRAHSPAADGVPVEAVRGETASDRAPIDTEAATGVGAASWLRRRVLRSGGGSGGGGGGGGGGDDQVDSHPRGPSIGGTGSHRGKRPVEGGMRQWGAANHVAAVLPVGPHRTKVFVKLEVKPSKQRTGRPLWWSRRVQRGLLIEALHDAANAAGAVTAAENGGGGSSRRRSSAAQDWLEDAAIGQPFSL